MGNASVKAHHHSKSRTHKNHGHHHSNYKYRHTKRNNRHNHKHCHCNRKNCNHRGGSPRPITGSPLRPGSSKTASSPKPRKNRRTSKSLLNRLQ